MKCFSGIENIDQQKVKYIYIYLSSYWMKYEHKYFNLHVLNYGSSFQQTIFKITTPHGYSGGNTCAMH